jgi:hypothetical protein
MVQATGCKGLSGINDLAYLAREENFITLTPGSSVLFGSWADEVLTTGPFENDVISFVFGSLESRECSEYLNFKIRISNYSFSN